VSTEKTDAEKVHILHVDDEPEVRLLISASLRELGYVVATVGSVAEALRLAGGMKFKLCILDLRLPDGGGIELCQQLRKLQPDASIVYCSAYADEATVTKALSTCGDAYLKKPISMAELERTIAGLINEKMGL
jgi:CheY-like chemotaxis protein